jgi:teichuronic acid biosynthesis glycosyltransferase TuaG
VNNNSPTVTVVIPTFNQADYLREALRSVINQSFTNWCAIVVNNFSTDHTRRVVAEYNDTRLTVVDFHNEGIIAASRNIGIQGATSTYIAFLDSDDWWMPTKLARCVDELAKGYDLVCHSEEWRSTKRSRVVHYGPASRTGYRALLLGGNCISTSAVVGRTDMFLKIGGFSTSPEFVTAEDYELWLRLAREEFRFSFIREVLGVFRIHDASASSSIKRNSDAERAVVEHHLATAPFVSRQIRRRRLALSHYGAARGFYRADRPRQALQEFHRSIQLSPLFPRAYAGICLTLLSSLRNLRSHQAPHHD